MKKILLYCLGLSLCLFLTACSIIVTSEKGDKTPEQETAPPSAAAYAEKIQQLTADSVAELANNDIVAAELTQELKEQFFDLAEQERWDFLPKFGYGGVELPENMSDYIYLITAQSLVWQDHYNIDHELTPEKFSTDYVDNYMQTRFGFTPAHPEPGEEFDSNPDYKGIEFDGEYYSSNAEWGYPPLYGLAQLLLEENEGHIEYEAILLYYSSADGDIGIPENAKEIICSMSEDKPGLTPTSSLHLRFYFDENNIPVYLAVEL